MTQPPRVPESVMEALGAGPDFRDDVLGDLRAEFSVRADRDGMGAARRWYTRESLRAIPYLARDGARGVTVGGAVRPVRAALVAFLTVLLVGLGLVAAMRVTVAWLGLSPTLLLPLSWTNVGLALMVVVLGAPAATMGGYVAASRYRNAPLAAAVTLGILWAGGAMTLLGWARVTPPWYRFEVALIVLVFTLLGGILRVCRRDEQPGMSATSPECERLP